MRSHKGPQDGGSWYRNLVSRVRRDRHLSDSDVAALAYGSDFVGPVTGAAPVSALVSARGHMNTCETCRERVRSARAHDAASAALLVALDAPTPTFDVAPVLARARTSAPGREYGISPKFARVRRTRQYTIAASLMLAMIGVTALAFPGSPLRMMLQRVTTTHRPGGAVEAARATQPRREIESSVAIIPAAHLAIEFSGAAVVPPVLTVRYCDTAFASLRIVRPDAPRATGAAPRVTSQTASFTVSADRIVVTRASEDDSGATYELMVPDSTRGLSVTANGKSVTLMQRHPTTERRDTDSCDPAVAVAWTP